MAIQTFYSSFGDVRSILIDGTAWFGGRDIALCLGYAIPHKAVREHVFPEDRATLADLQPNDKGDKQTVYISEPGVYALIFSSKTKAAVDFKKWVCRTLLPSVRRAGKEHCQPPLLLKCEADLHHRVVAFIRRFFSHALLAPGLGELQDDSNKRLYSYRCGYQGGQPDILILNLHKRFTGFALELKHPNGTGRLSQNQAITLERYRAAGFRTLLSNDYDLIIKELLEYSKDTRLGCPHCRLRFKSQETLTTHLHAIHHIK